MECLFIKKTAARALLKKRLLDLSKKRREEAKEKIASLSLPEGNILSFSSLADEIDTSLLNQKLLATERLCLPKMEEGSLVMYEVKRKEDLLLHPLGFLEPDPLKCKRVENVSLLLIPGLGFAPSLHRLGRGKGIYDRFLKDLPYDTLGVGFQEQLLPFIPFNERDIPLKKLMLL